MPSKEILVFSYYTNVPGVCQAEWVDDRMNAFIEKGYMVTIISCTYSFPHQHEKIKHIKVPALSPHGAAYEYNEIKDKKVPVAPGFSYFYTWLMHHLNKLLQRVHLNSGEGRWSWFISAFIAAMMQVRNKRNLAFIYSTGGPPSADLAAILIGKLFQKKVIVEFQDPLSGEDIGRSKFSARGLRFFEKIIIRWATVVIYCTRSAMEFARHQYPAYQSKIDYVYPGSKPSSTDEVQEFAIENAEPQPAVNISYLGSLYQTRNLDTLMKAIDELMSEGIKPNIQINIYGVMNTDIRERITKFQHPGYFILHGHVSRGQAIKKARQADVLLLVQHTDMRSKTTIPFKLYDYLHSGNLIWGLIYRNTEIEQLLTSHGHLVCQADDIKSIKDVIIRLSDYKHGLESSILPSSLTPAKAIDKMIELLKLD